MYFTGILHVIFLHVSSTKWQTEWHTVSEGIGTEWKRQKSLFPILRPFLFQKIIRNVWNFVPPFFGTPAKSGQILRKKTTKIRQKSGCEILKPESFRFRRRKMAFLDLFSWLPSSKLTWQWKFTFSNRKYIFKWWIFHCYVSLPEGIFFFVYP